jgi:hypothetical protein
VRPEGPSSHLGGPLPPLVKTPANFSGSNRSFASSWTTCKLHGGKGPYSTYHVKSCTEKKVSWIWKAPEDGQHGGSWHMRSMSHFQPSAPPTDRMLDMR